MKKEPIKSEDLISSKNIKEKIISFFFFLNKNNTNKNSFRVINGLKF